MLKRILLLLLLLAPCVFFAQNPVRVVDNKGTLRFIDQSKWFQVNGDLFNKNTTGNVGIGLPDTSTRPAARLFIDNGGGPTPTLGLKGLSTGLVTDNILLWNSTDFSVKYIDRTTLIAEPWFSTATGKGATLNTEDVYIMGKAMVGTNAPGTVANVAPTAANFTVVGGDASINTLTIGEGGGQKPSNTAIGNSTLFNNNSGTYNTAVGYNVLLANTSGSSNTGVGYNALASNSTGSSNSAFGQTALFNTTGSNNSGFGSGALNQNTTGANNTAIGSLSILGLTTGSFNTALGYNVGPNLTSGNYNIIIGSGNKIDVPIATGSNQMNIGNTIFGTGINSATVGAGNIGIGTTAPATKLEVKSDTPDTSGLRLTNLTSGSPFIAGSKAIGVNATGDVVTTDVSLAANAWNRNGNNITASPTDFLGTTTANDLVMKTNNTEKMRLTSAGQLLVNTPTSLTGGTNAKVQINNGTTAGAIQIVDGTQGSGKVLTSDANGVATWAPASNWNINGNAGTVEATNFIGTTDNVGLNFRTNNINRFNVTASGDMYIYTNATNRIWGVSGLTTGQTVHFQYGGDTFNDIVCTFGAAPQFKAYHGIQFYNASGEVARFGLAQNNQNSYFKNSLSVGSATSPSNILHVFSAANTSGVRLEGLKTAPAGTSTSYLAVDANGDIVRGAAVSSTTTVSNTSTANNLTTTVNGVTGAAVNIVNSNDLTVDATGKLTSTVNGVADPTPVQVVVDANNGLTPTNGVVQLGGVLAKPTTITTDVTNTLAVSGLQSSASGTDNLVVSDPATGVLRTLNHSVLDNNWHTTGNAGTNPSTNYLGTNDAQDLVVKTNNTEKMRVLASNGNIGIGAIAPAAKLEVNSGTADTSGLRLSQLKSTSPAPIAYNSKVLTVNATGDVGLTTVPGTESIVDFSVNADPNTMGTIFSPDIQSDRDIVYISTIDNSSWTWNGAGYVAYTPTTTAWIQGGNSVPSPRTLGTKTNVDLPIITNNTERMRVTSTGNVGIGAAAATEKLEVNGTVKANNYISPIQPFSGSAVTWNMDSGSNATWTLAAGTNTLTITNAKAGMYGSIIVTNTGGTSTINFASGITYNKVINGGGGSPALTPVNGAVDILTFFYDGNKFWWTVGNNYN